MTPEEKRNAVNELSMGLLNQCRIIAEDRGPAQEMVRVHDMREAYWK